MRLPKTLLMAAAVAASSVGFAANYQWDVNGSAAGLGGAGTWDTATANWDLVGTAPDDGTAATQAVTFTNADSATFGGTAGAVTLNTAVTLNALIFNTPGYTVSGSGVITLAGTTPTITTATGANATISNVLTGTAGLVKDGAGTLSLSALNTLTGGITVNAGTLLLTRSGEDGNSVLKGVVTVNSGATLNWSARSALGYNANTISTLNINGGTVGGGNFRQHFYNNSGTLAINMTGGELILGDVADSNNANMFRNAPITVIASANQSKISGTGAMAIRDGSTQTFNVGDGTQAVDLLVSAIILENSGTGALLKTGAGTMALTGANGYNGITTVGGGTLLLSGANGAITTSAPTVNGGATLKIDNTSAANSTNRLGDAKAVTLNGGTLEFANDGSSTAFSETAGVLTLNGAGSTVRTSQSGLSSVLTFASLSRSGGTVNFAGTGLGANARNQIKFTTAPTLTNGLIGPWATYNGTDFASYDATNGVVAYAGYTDVKRLDVAANTIGDSPAANVRIVEGSGTAFNLLLGAPTTTVNTLIQSASGGTGAATIALSGVNNTLSTNSILVASGASGLTLGTVPGEGTLKNPGTALTVIENSTGGSTINAVIANGTGASSLTKSGTGTLTLAALNTYTGVTYVGEGTLKFGVANAIAGSGIIASGGTIDLGGFNQSLLGLRTDGLTAPVVTNSAAGTGTNTLSITGGWYGNFSGSIQDGATAKTAVVVSGANGRISWGGNSTFTGGLTLNGDGATDGGDARVILGVASDSALGGVSNVVTLNNGGTLFNATSTTGGWTGSTAPTLAAGRTLVMGSGAGGVIRVYGGTTFTIDSTLGGVGGLTKTDTGTLLLRGALTYTGGTAIAGGTLEINASSNQTLAGAISGSGALTKSGTGTLTLAGLNTVTGSIAINAGTLEFSSPARQTLSGVISGGGTLLKSGTGALVLGGANTYSSTSVTGGLLSVTGSLAAGSTINIGPGAILAFNQSGAQSLSGVISGTGTLAKYGTGTLSLSGANTFDGTLAVNSGTVNLDFANAASAANILPAATRLSLGGGTLQVTGKASTTNSQAFAGTTLAGGSQITLTPNVTANPLLLNLGAIVRTAGATLNINQPTGVISATNGVVTSTANNASGILGGWATVTDATTTDWAVANAGSGITAYTGYIVLPTSGASAATHYRMSAATTLGGSMSVNTLKMEAPSGNLVIGTGNTLTIQGGGLLFTGSTARDITGGTITAGNGSGAYELIVHQAGAANLSLYSVIADNGGNAVSLVKSGAGTLILNESASQTYTGRTIINGGNLTMFAASGVPTYSGGVIEINNGATLQITGGRHDFTNTNFTFGASGGGAISTGSGLNWVAQGAGWTFTTSGGAKNTIGGSVGFNLNNTSGVVFNVVRGIDGLSDLDVTQQINNTTGVLTKNGDGILTLSAINNYTGGTTVNAGVLRLMGGGGSGIIRGTVTVNAGATLRLSGTDAVGYNTGADRLGVININGGTLDLNNGLGATPGNQTLGNAAINLTGGSITGAPGSNLDFYQGSSSLSSLASPTTSTVTGVTLNIRQAAGVTITVADGAAAEDLRINSRISQSVAATGNALIKAGTGVLVLAGVNTYTGPTAINAGILRIADTGSLNSGNYGAVISGAGVLEYASTSTQTLSGANTYTGGTVVSAGTLRSGHASAFGAGPMTVNGGTVDLNGNSMTLLSLSGTGGAVALGGGTLTLSDNTSPTYAGSISGMGGLIKQGTGTLTLTGVNTYTGNTSIAGGLTLSGAGVLGNGNYGGNITGSGVFTYASSATQVLSGANTYSGGTVVSAGNLTFSGAGAMPANRSLTVNNGSVNLGGTARSVSVLSGTGGAIDFGAGVLSLTQTTNTTYAGTLAGSVALAKTGTGTLTLSGNNTGLTGGVTLSSGTLELGSSGAIGSTGAILMNGGTLRYSSSNNADYSSRFSASSTAYNIDTNGIDVAYATAFGGAGATLTKSGSGVLTLSGANTYGGVTTINGGTIKLGNAAALGTATGAADGTVVNTGGTLDLNGVNGIAEALTLNGGALVNSGAALTFSGNLTLQSDAVLGGNLTFTGVISGATLSVTKSAADTNELILSGNNTYGGGTTVGAGTLTAGSTAAFGAASVTVATGATLNVAGQSIGNALVLNGTGVTGAGALVNTGAATTLAGTVSLASDTTIGGTGNLTLGGQVSGAGALTVGTVANPLTLRLNADNTGYSAGIAVESGSTLVLGHAKALGSSQVTLNGGTLDFGSLTDITLGGISGTGSVQGSANLTVDVATGQSNTISLVLSGGISLTKTGLGELELSNSNTYTGATSVQQGTLIVGDGATSGSIAATSAVAVSTGATFVLDRSDVVTFTNTLTGSGTFEQRGTGVTTLSGTATGFTGNILISGGTLVLASANSAGGATRISLAGGATFDLNGQDVSAPMTVTGGTLTNGATGDASTVSGAIALTNNLFVLADVADITLSGVISGTGSLTKTGSGTLTVSGANTYSGGIELRSGTLVAGSTTAFGSGILSLNGGTLNVNGQNLVTGGIAGSTGLNLGATVFTANVAAGTVSYDGVLSGTGAFTKTGAGTQILTADQTYQGVTTINGGVLVVGGSLATSSVTLGGGTLSLNSPGALIFATTVSGSGSLTHAGADVLTLSGNNTYSGVTTVNGGGTLRLGSTNALGATGATNGTVVVTGSTLDLNGFATAESLTIVGTGVGAQGALLNSSTTAASVSGTVTLSGDTTIGGAGDQGDITLSGVVSGAAARLTYAGGHTLTLGAANTFAGLTVTSGTVNAGAVGAFGSTGGTLNVALGATANLNGFNQTVGGIDGTGSVNLGGATLTLNQTTDTTFGGTLAGAGNLTKTGAGALTLSQANTYTGTTTIAGGTVVLGNAAALGATGGLAGTVVSTGATLDLNGQQGIAETIRLSGGTLANRAPGAIGSTPNPTPPPAHTILVNTAAEVTGNVELTSNSTIVTDGDIMISGVVSGSGRLTKTGAGRLVLNSANVYSGGTSLNEGIIIIGNANALGSGSVTVAAGSQLFLNGFSITNSVISSGGFVNIANSTLTVGSSASDTFSGNITDEDPVTFVRVAGNLVKVGTGTTSLTGTNLYTGTTTVNAGTLRVSGAGSLGSLVPGIYTGNVSIASGGTFEIGTTANQNLTGVVSGAGSLAKSGSGTLTISGDNTYTGQTRITGGTVIADSATAFGNNSSVLISSATVQMNNDLAMGSLSGAGSVEMGAHTLTIGGNNIASTYGGFLNGTAATLVKLGSAEFEYTTNFAAGQVGNIEIRSGDFRHSGQMTTSRSVAGGSTTVSRMPILFGPLSMIFVHDDGNLGVMTGVTIGAPDSVSILGSGRLSFQNTQRGLDLGLESGSVGTTLRYNNVMNLQSSAQGALQTGLDSTYRVALYATQDSTLGILEGKGRFYKTGPAKLTVLNESSFTGDVMLVEGDTELDSSQGRAFASARSVNLGHDGGSTFRFRVSTGHGQHGDTGLFEPVYGSLGAASLTLANSDQAINNLNPLTDSTAASVGEVLRTGRGANTSINLSSRMLTVNQTQTGWYNGSVFGDSGAVLNKTGSAALVLQGAGSIYGNLRIADGMVVANVQSLGAVTDIRGATTGTQGGKLSIVQTNAGHLSSNIIGSGDLVVGIGAAPEIPEEVRSLLPTLNSGTLTLTHALDDFHGRLIMEDGVKLMLGTDTATIENALSSITSVVLRDNGFGREQEINFKNSNQILNNLNDLTYNAAGNSSLARLNFGTGSLTLNQNTALTYAGTMTGTGAFIKSGTAKVTVTNPTSYFGSTVVRQGALSGTAESAFINSGALVVGGKTAGVSASFETNVNQKFGALFGADGALVKMGAGNLTIGLGAAEETRADGESTGGVHTILATETGGAAGAFTNASPDVTRDYLKSQYVAAVDVSSGYYTTAYAAPDTASAVYTAAQVDAARFDSGVYTTAIADPNRLTATDYVNAKNSPNTGSPVYTGALVDSARLTNDVYAAALISPARLTDSGYQSTYATVYAQRQALGDTPAQADAAANAAASDAYASRIYATERYASDVYGSNRYATHAYAADVYGSKSAENLDFAGTISGTGQLIKVGSQTLTLSGSNTYTGDTLVQGGKLVIDADALYRTVAGTAQTTPGNIRISSGATLALRAGVGEELAMGSSVYGGAGSTIQKLGAGTVELGGVAFGNATATGEILAGDFAGTFDIAEGRLRFNTKTDTTLAGSVTGPGILGKTGAGALTLSNATDFTGKFEVSNASKVVVITRAPSLVNDVSVELGGEVRFALAGGISHTYVGGPNGMTGRGTVSFAGEDVTIAAQQNAFTGTLSVLAGTELTAGVANIAPNARLDVTGDERTVGSVTYVTNAVFNDAGLAQAFTGITGNAQGVYTLNGTTTLNVGTGNSATYSGGITGTGNLVIASGTQVLRTTDANTGWTGSVTVASGATLETTVQAITGLAGTSRVDGSLNILVDTGLVESLPASAIIQGAGTLGKTGGGTLELGSVNFSGTLHVIEGTAVATGASRGGNVYANTVVDRNGIYQVVLSTANTTSGVAGLSGQGTLALTGAQTLTLTQLQGTGASAHTGNIWLQGGANLNLAANSIGTVNGLAADAGSTVQVASSGALTIAQSANGAFKGSFSGLTDLTVTAGNDTAHTAGVFTYGVDTTSTLSLANITVSGGGQMVTTGNLDVSNTVYVTGVGSSLTIGKDLTGVANLNISGGTLRILGQDLGTGSVVITNGTLSLSTLSSTRTYELNNATLDLNVVNATDTLVLNRPITVVTPPATLSKSGAGVLSVVNAGTFNGDILVNAGTMRLDSDTAFNPTNTVGTITVAGGTLALNGHNLTGSTLNGSAAGAITLGTATLTVNQAAGGTFAGVISGDGSLVKNGTEMLTLSGANTYTGGTTVNSGTLRLGANEVLSNTGKVTIATGATLDVNGKTETLGTLGGGGKVTLGSGSLIVNQAGAGTLGGFTGTGSLTKNGTGTLTLNGYGNTVGALTVNSGILSIGNSMSADSLSGTGEVNLVAGSLLTVNRPSGSPQTFEGTFTGSGSFTKSGVGTQVLTGNSNAFTGRITIAAGRLVVGNGGTTGNLGTGNIINNGVLELNRSGAYTFGSVVSGGGSVEVHGGGTVTITANNVYAGSTTIAADTIVNIGSGGILGSLGTGNIVNSGTLVFNRSDSVSVSNLMSGAGSLTQSGTGTLTLAGTNTGITGNVGVTSGKLVVPTASLPSGTYSSNGAGVLSFNGTGPASISKDISGNGLLEFVGNGGTTTLNMQDKAYAFSGDVSVGSGHTLRLGTSSSQTASMASADLTVQTGGRLTGSGTFASITNYGTVAPGFSPGIIATTGNFVTTGTMDMQIEGTLDAGIAGGYDQVRFGGSARLGGTLNLTVASDIAPGTQVVLMHDTDTSNNSATNPSFTGNFVNVALSNNFGSVFVSGANLVYFAGTSIADTAGLVLHDGVDAFAGALKPANLQVVHPNFADFAGISSNTAKAIALQNASPVGLAALTALPLGQMTKESEDIRRRAESQRLNTDAVYGDDAEWVTYVAGNGGMIDNDKDERSAPTFDTRSYGGAVGIERRLGTENDAAVGIRLAYDRGTADFHHSGGRANQDHARATVYGIAMLGEDAYLSAGFGLGYSAFDTKRNTILGTMKGSPTGWDVSGTIDVGMLLRVNKEWTFAPHAGVGFLSAKVGSFTETGPSGSYLPLSVDGYSQNSVYARIGTGLFKEWGGRNVSRSSLRVGVDVSYEHEMLDDTVAIDASFANYPNVGQFSTEAPSLMRDRLVVGPQVQWLIDETSSISAGYRMEFGFNGALGQRFDVSFEQRF